MLDFSALDVAVGLFFLWFVLSLICSALNEIIASTLRWRAKTLGEGIENLLSGTDDPKNGAELAAKVYNHPLMQGLIRPGQGEKRSWPSYVPSRTFVAALLSLGGLATDQAPTARDLLATIDALPNEQMKQALTTLLQSAPGDVAKFQASAVVWFERVDCPGDTDTGLHGSTPRGSAVPGISGADEIAVRGWESTTRPGEPTRRRMRVRREHVTAQARRHEVSGRLRGIPWREPAGLESRRSVRSEHGFDPIGGGYLTQSSQGTCEDVSGWPRLPPARTCSDGTGPPPQGLPSTEGSLRAPFPFLKVGELMVAPPAACNRCAPIGRGRPLGRQSRPSATTRCALVSL